MGTNRINIEKPIWGHQSVGVAEWRMTADIIEVDILYRDKSGRKVYPHLYRIGRVKAMTYPVQIVKGTRLRIIPLANCQEIVSLGICPPCSIESQSVV